MKYLKLYEAFATQTKAKSQDFGRSRGQEESDSGNDGNNGGNYTGYSKISFDDNPEFKNMASEINPPKCQPGWHFDKIKNMCVPDETKTPKKLDSKKLAYSSLGDCPPDKIFNPTTNTCDNPPSIPSDGKDEFIFNELFSILSENYNLIIRAYEGSGIYLRNLYKDLDLLRKLSMGMRSNKIFSIKRNIETIFSGVSIDKSQIKIDLSKDGNIIMKFEYYCGLILEM